MASYFVAIGQPLFHLFALMLLPLAFEKIAPLGTDYAVFAATGILPYILCLYPSRMMLVSLIENKPLLAFPIVKPPDIIWARALLEIVISFSVMLIFLASLLALNFEVVPFDVANATYAIMSTIFFGIGFGFVSAVLESLFRGWIFVHIILIIVMYITSGAFFITRSLPEELRELIWYNPLFHCVEWLLVAYFEGYNDDMLSRSYLLGLSLVLLFLGSLIERVLRGRIVMG